MIFHCPACSAGHSVPVSMIPNGGMEMTCRRCSTSFDVDVEDPDDDEDPTVAARAEATAIGVANPYDELVGHGAHLIGPTGEIFRDASRPATQDPTLDRPTIPIDTHGIPLGPDEVGVDPELDNTQRVDVDEDPTHEPSVRTLNTPPPRRVGPPKPPLDDRPIVVADDDLYAKVASGRYVAPEPSVAPAAVPRARAWNEPSSIVQVGDGPVSRLRRLAEALNAAPLALKVGLIVFPVTLGIALVVTAMTKNVEPTTIPPPEAAAAAPARVASETERVAEEAAPPAAPEPAAPTGPLASDTEAPEGYAFVQTAQTKMRSTAARRGRAVARLEAGQLVRRYESKDTFALVLVEPDGPVGFVAEQALGDRKPIAALADALAFDGCSAEDRSIDECLFGAKSQEDRCVDTCGAANDPSAVRCREACGVAFDRCTRGCQPKRRRRRR